MAGHKTSGYAASLWQALFASLIQLFTRCFHSNSATESTRKPPQQHLHTSTTTSTTQNSDSSSLCAPSPQLPPPQQQQQHPHRHNSFIDLEQGLHSSSPDDTMAPSKKRGGQKRRGPKAKGSRSATPTAPSENLSNAASNNSTAGQSSAPPMTIQNPGPANVTSVANQGDTKVDSHQADGQASTGAGRDSRSGGPAPPNPLADRKENSTIPLKTYSSVAQSQSPALKPLVVENQAQPQNAGTRSQQASTALTPSIKPEMPENVLPKKGIEEISAGTASLALGGVSRPGGPAELTPTSTTITPKASTLPAPVVVLPLADGAATPKPTPAPALNLPGLIEPQTEEGRAEREYHLKYMREALSMGYLALQTNETPVGCVLVYHGRVIAKGMNATNVTRNGTRHAEFMALSALLSRRESGDVDVDADKALDDASWGDVNPADGHIFPYGQKLHPAPVVNREILSECVLYVTVEPCVMCASLLRQLGIKKVYFGCVNDKFGGTGGVFKIHMNSKPVKKPDDRPYQNGYGPPNIERIVKGRPVPKPRDEDDGDGGNIERGYPVEGGYLRDEAVSLLRRFYVQENGRAPQPRKKEGRAARLFALETQVKNSGNSSGFSDCGTPRFAAAGPQAPADDGGNMSEAVDSPTAV
ncbi:cytidine deaminase-like protein [Hypoxylon sp. FL0543]|nr:cytidine deaminase-like protein [Hypoxylon sp. FL0543]